MESAEAELATLDQKQESKRQELVAAEDELAKSKERILDAEAEEKRMTEQEGKLAKRYTQLMVCATIDFVWGCF
jgi:structural maintenance of chromosome 4